MASTLTSKQQFWSEQLERADQSGLSLSDFAKAQNIPVQKLYQWRSTLRKKTTVQTVCEEIQFAEVSTSGFAPPLLSLHLGDVTLQFGHLPDYQWLGALLNRVNAK